MTRATVAEAAASLPPHKLAALEARLRWLKQARPKQIPPRHLKWYICLICAGRGFGKSRCAAEDTWWQAAWNDNTRWTVVAPTSNDLRRTCFEGESGLVNVVPRECLRNGSIDSAYNKSLFEMHFANGSMIQGQTAESYERLRGPQYHGAWIDELCAWANGAEQPMKAAFDMLNMTLRLGNDPRIVIATTPKPVKLIKDLVKREDVLVVSGSTYENKANLAQPFLDMLEREYSGTRLGRQELEAEILSDIDGAYWTWQMIEDARYTGICPEFTMVTVNIDPSVSDGSEGTDECGITCTGLGKDGYGYLLLDRSLSASPKTWADVAVRTFHEQGANWIVAEQNQGGKMVEATIHAVDSNVPVRLVSASRGKAIRAEPVAALYEQRRIRHFGRFDKLEEQLTSWSPAISKFSPDRLDSLVWGFTALMVEKPSEFFCFPI